jgi:bifunctional DNA-binding transcriptional regulator/antitoxin component of YhaV-PrlF toxin-antitoxin module
MLSLKNWVPVINIDCSFNTGIVEHRNGPPLRLIIEKMENQVVAMDIEKINVGGNRVWIPKKYQKLIHDKFLEIEIRKNERSVKFLSRINCDGRLVIPKGFAKQLNIGKGDVVNVNIGVIENIERKSKLFDKEVFDLLSFIPKRTMSGFEIFVKEHGEKLILWYSARGRPKEIEINRYVPIKFSRLLGYYQAEGTKPILRKRRGRELSFTNKSIRMIKDFIEISRTLFDVELWNATVRYNHNIEMGGIEDLITSLPDMGIRKSKIKCKEAKRISSYTIKIWITNSVLVETIFNMMEKIREHIISNDSNGNGKKILKYFLQGLIAGDGSFNVLRDKNNSQHSFLSIYEGNEKYAKDYKSMMEKMQIYGNIRKDNRKNLFVFHKPTNWDDLLRLLEYELFCRKSHFLKLKKAITEHKRYRSLKYLDLFSRDISTSDFRKLTNRSYEYTYTWLRDREREKMIERLDKRNGMNIWRLNEKGKKMRKLMSDLKYNRNIISLP